MAAAAPGPSGWGAEIWWASEDSPPPASLGPAPSVAGLMTDLVTEIVENHITGMWLIAETVSGVLQAVRGRLFGTGEAGPTAPAASSISGPVPHTVFNEPLTKRRAVAFASISLEDAKAVSNAFGGSITNVVLAACTLSLRAWLERFAARGDGEAFAAIVGPSGAIRSP